MLPGWLWVDIQLIRLIGEFVVDLTSDTLCKAVTFDRTKSSRIGDFRKLFVFGDRRVNFSRPNRVDWWVRVWYEQTRVDTLYKDSVRFDSLKQRIDCILMCFWWWSGELFETESGWLVSSNLMWVTGVWTLCKDTESGLIVLKAEDRRFPQTVCFWRWSWTLFWPNRVDWWVRIWCGWLE